MLSFLALAALALQTPDGALTAPPEVIEYKPFCVCNGELPETRALSGVAIDAQLTIAPNGKDVEDRQATIFRVIRGAGFRANEQVRVFHNRKPETCGVVFDYGRRYTVNVFETESGLETNFCVDPRRTEASSSSEN